MNGVPLSRFNDVPADPATVSPPPIIIPLKLAAPAVFDIVTVPVVVNAPIL